MFCKVDVKEEFNHERKKKIKEPFTPKKNQSILLSYEIGRRIIN